MPSNYTKYKKRLKIVITIDKSREKTILSACLSDLHIIYRPEGAFRERPVNRSMTSIFIKGFQDLNFQLHGMSGS